MRSIRWRPAGFREAVVAGLPFGVFPAVCLAGLNSHTFGRWTISVFGGRNRGRSSGRLGPSPARFTDTDRKPELRRFQVGWFGTDWNPSRAADQGALPAVPMAACPTRPARPLHRLLSPNPSAYRGSSPFHRLCAILSRERSPSATCDQADSDGGSGEDG